jgi:hypothetical protein
MSRDHARFGPNRRNVVPPSRLVWFRGALAALAFAAWALPAADARADDPPTFADRPDREAGDTDRRLAVLVNPLAVAVGVFGAEGDFVLGPFAAIALEGDVYRRGGTTSTGLGAGLLFFPQGVALQGLYLEPRVVYARPLSESMARIDWGADVLGFGATAGWQWTWDYGLSIRLGGGAMDLVGGRRRAALGDAIALGPVIVLDGSLGWAF